MTLQEQHRQRVLSAMERRRLSPTDVARMAGRHQRTVQRFLDGTTFSLETLACIEAALRLGSADVAPVDRPAQLRTNVHSGPVAGWKQAARMLGMHRNTLKNQRAQHGDRTRKPWWRDVEALWRWYDRMISTEVG